MFDGASLCRRSSANVSVEKLSKLVYGFQILKRPGWKGKRRSEEHTSELQSQSNLVCRLLLEKKNKQCRYPVLPLFRPPRVRTRTMRRTRPARCRVAPAAPRLAPGVPRPTQAGPPLPVPTSAD